MSNFDDEKKIKELIIKIRKDYTSTQKMMPSQRYSFKEGLNYFLARELNSYFQTELNQKDQRIAELEKEKQTAVKEFAEEIKNCIKNNSLTYNGFDEPNFSRNKMYVRSANILDFIKEMLKEMGIE